MARWKCLILLGMTTVFAGCVSLKTPENTQLAFRHRSWQQRQAQLNRQRYFIANGAFSIAEKGKKPVLANYQWVQKNANYRIRVSSTLDLFDIMILGQPQSVTLWQGRQKQIIASTPERLLQREMGWALPIRNLFYWIRGIVAPGQKQITIDQYGHLTSLRQNGWFIRYSHYTHVAEYDLPEKVILQRPSVMITIVIKHWTI